MNTIQLQNHISTEQYQMAVRVLNAMGIKTKRLSVKEEKKDDAEMTKEEYFAMIDKSSKGEKRDITLQEFENKYLK